MLNLVLSTQVSDLLLDDGGPGGSQDDVFVFDDETSLFQRSHHKSRTSVSSRSGSKTKTKAKRRRKKKAAKRKGRRAGLAVESAETVTDANGRLTIRTVQRGEKKAWSSQEALFSLFSTATRRLLGAELKNPAGGADVEQMIRNVTNPIYQSLFAQEVTVPFTKERVLNLTTELRPIVEKLDVSRALASAGKHTRYMKRNAMRGLLEVFPVMTKYGVSEDTIRWEMPKIMALTKDDPDMLGAKKVLEPISRAVKVAY